jgi:hypothetical protein
MDLGVDVISLLPVTCDELVWSHMKRTGTAKRPLAPKESLQDRVEADLFKIMQNRALVQSFFKAPAVAYISDA